MATVWVVTAGDLTHGSGVSGVYATRELALEIGVPEAFREQSRYYGGSPLYTAHGPLNKATYFRSLSGGTNVHVKEMPLHEAAEVAPLAGA